MDVPTKNTLSLKNTQKRHIIFTKNFTAKELKHMPNIKPVSDLRNYSEVLRDISYGKPVFLTKNGRGRYAILDMEEYEKTVSTLKLLSALAKGEQSAVDNGWKDLSEVEDLLGINNV